MLPETPQPRCRDIQFLFREPRWHVVCVHIAGFDSETETSHGGFSFWYSLCPFILTVDSFSAALKLQYTCSGQRGQQAVVGISESLCTHASTTPAQPERSLSRTITDIHEAQAYAKGVTRLRRCRRPAPPPAQRADIICTAAVLVK